MKFDKDQLHVVVGATGGTGSSLVGTLARAGVRVRAVARSLPQELPAGVEAAPADALDVARVCEVCKCADDLQKRDEGVTTPAFEVDAEGKATKVAIFGSTGTSAGHRVLDVP